MPLIGKKLNQKEQKKTNSNHIKSIAKQAGLDPKKSTWKDILNHYAKKK